MSSTRSHDVTVLLIEDEAEIRRFLRSTLPVHGYRLYEATTGADGLAQASARNPDIILLDLGLPDLDGSEVCRRIEHADHRAFRTRPGTGQGASLRSWCR